MTGIPFGDPRHPFTQTSATASANGKKGAKKSYWSRHPMVLTERAAKIFAERHSKEKTP